MQQTRRDAGAPPAEATDAHARVAEGTTDLVRAKLRDHAIRVFIVDDHPTFRMGLAALIDNHDDMVVVGEAASGEEALERFDAAGIDVVLMDLRLPGLGGVETTLALRARFPEARIIVLTTYDNDEDIHRALESGARSYLLKDMPAEEIAGMIRAVHQGRSELPGVVASRLAERNPRQSLSVRELDVLNQLVRGRSNKEIAAGLFISEDTVKTHLRTIFSRLGVRDRTEAAISAIRHGIIHLP